MEENPSVKMLKEFAAYERELARRIAEGPRPEKSLRERLREAEEGALKAIARSYVAVVYWGKEKITGAQTSLKDHHAEYDAEYEEAMMKAYRDGKIMGGCVAAGSYGSDLWPALTADGPVEIRVALAVACSGIAGLATIEQSFLTRISSLQKKKSLAGPSAYSPSETRKGSKLRPVKS